MAETNFSPTQEQLDKTQDFIEDENSYIPFSVIDGKRYSWCIHPTDEKVDNLRVVVQTPGAAHGEGVDAGIAYSCVSERLIAPSEALKKDIELRRMNTIQALHDKCAFAGAIREVLAEMAAPKPFTEESTEEWMYLYKVGKAKERPSLIEQVQEGALEQSNNLTPTTIEEMVFVADSRSPYQTYTDVKGPNQARYYIVNHQPHLGVNRHTAHREQKLDVQFYHDSLGAVIWDARNIQYPEDQPHVEKLRALRLTSIIRRSAAARTLLSFPEPVGLASQQNTLYEVHMSEHGPKAKQLEPVSINQDIYEHGN